MGQIAEESDGQAVAENLMENILNEVTRSITERTESSFDSFESLKLQTFGSEDILDYGCSRREKCGKYKEYEPQENVNADVHVEDLCYPSLANLPEVCVHSSSIEKSSKQGEGDFQLQTIREAVTFYRLETGEEENLNLPSGSKDFSTSTSVHKEADNIDTDQVKNSPETVEEGNFANGTKDCKHSCSSSCTTEMSHDQLIEDLQRSINNVSFDSVHLSDDSSQEPMRSPVDACLKDDETWNKNCACLFDDQCRNEDDSSGSYVCPYEQSCMHQSKKFCQVKNVNFFPRQEIPSDYCQLVNESYEKYESIAKEEDEETLLSDGSSEELVIIERDEIDQIMIDDCYPQANHFQAPFLCSVTPSTMVLSQFSSCIPGTSYSSAEPSDIRNRITVVADVEPTRGHRNWEEALEVQVNVTEPMRLTEMDDDDEDCELLETRKYWTTVGLMTENNVDPKLISDDSNGIESVPGMLRVKERRVTRDRRQQEEDEILTFNEFIEREKNEKLSQHFGGPSKIQFEHISKQDHKMGFTENYDVEFENSGGNQSDAEKINYLNVSEGGARKDKQKNKFVSRLTKSLTNIFRYKKKNTK